MVFGELVPQVPGGGPPAADGALVGGSQLLFSMMFTPLIRMTNGTANWILRRLGIEPAEELRSARSPQELVSLVRSSARSGSLDPVTAVLVDRSLQFGERTAEELMTPRSKIEALESDDTVADLIATAIKTGYSRFPIIEGDFDETIGMIHIKQVFEVPPERRAATPLSTLALPVAKVPSTLDGDAVMTQIRANGLQTALVVDEYGGTAGMVTVEDLIEEIVGDVRDEHDVELPTCCRRPTAGRCPGCCASTKSQHATGFRAPEGDYETIGGLGARKTRPHPRPGRVGGTDGVQSRRCRAGRPVAVAGDGGPDGRPQHRPAGARELGPTAAQKMRA